MPQIVPSNPSKVMVIRDVVPNVVTTLSVPFLRVGLMRIGGRGTIVRLQSGALAIFSPVALTPEVKATLSKMGEVKYITALDIEHHIFLGPWHEAFPQAKVLGPECLPEKRAKQKNENVPFAVVFNAKEKESIKVDPEFDAEFDYEFVDAHMNKELVFCHKPSRTLIEADMLFNLPANEQYSKSDKSPTSGFLTKLFISLNNTKGAAIGQKRLLWYVSSSADRKGFGKSVDKIRSWDFDRIIPCHGDVIETGGKGIFEKVMEWYINGSKKSS